MEYKTLHELCEALHISRRAVQGYEQAGLVAATDRNKYGHLLYDEATLKRVERIQFYQQMGFTLRQIEGIIDASNEVLKAALEKQVQYLEREGVRIVSVIARANELISTL